MDHINGSIYLPSVDLLWQKTNTSKRRNKETQIWSSKTGLDNLPSRFETHSSKFLWIPAVEMEIVEKIVIAMSEIHDSLDEQHY